ncbi:MAG: alkaline phosphatase family protein [Bacteroidota bacterium]
MKIRNILVAAFVFLILNLNGNSQSRNAPKLAILISVDQMSPEYFIRFSSQMKGGFHRLYTKGIVYRNCSLDYAYTETGPGHATMATGCFPNKHGIYQNDWCNRRTRDSIYCVRDSSAKPIDGLGGFCSPLNLKVTTIGDWLKEVSPLSRVVSLSLKDRAAVLMGGHLPDVVCWYSKDSGKFVSSSYYGKHLPEFVQRFDESNFLDSIPPSWEKLPTDCDAMTSPDLMEGEKRWLGKSTIFPHELPEKSRNKLLQFTPFGDSLVLELALEGIKQMGLGRNKYPDLLCISLSCMDYIGHYFGPNSVEMCDQVERLDKYLGKFLDAIDNHMGNGTYAVILTSDHSIHPLPEYSTQYLHKNMQRIIDEYDVKPAIQKADSILKQRLNVKETLIDPRGFLEYTAAEEAGFKPADFEKQVYSVLREINFVKDVFFRRDLVGARHEARAHLEEFQKSYYAMNGPDFIIDFKNQYLLTDTSYPANHGMFCSHVPLIVYAGGGKAMKIDRKVLSVDIAPTLAQLLGISPPPGIDGKTLKEVAQGFKINSER